MGPTARVVIVSMVGLLIAGCVTEDPRRRNSAPAVQAPAGSQPAVLQIFAGAARDTNGNNYVDTVTITAFLFDEQRYDLPIRVEGSFTFRLTRADGTVLAEWQFSPEDGDRALVRMPPGPGYRFDLSLLAKGGDKLEPQAVDLTGVFTPVKGTPVTSAGGATLRLGRISL